MPADLAGRLIDRDVAAVDDVLSDPTAWPPLHSWKEPPTVRRRGIRPFRTNVVYFVAEGEVRVIAYAHERREPGYWANRIA